MDTALLTMAAGLGTGLSLIVAIGAQNAFVLRQGIRRENVPAIVAICATSDAVLIACGVAGIGAALQAWPAGLTAVAWIGGMFLLCYGALAARRALRPSSLTLDRSAPADRPRTAVLTCLALTWLNPHVYLDTVLLLGSVANGYGERRWLFGVGAAAGSALWFSGLGFGARLLRGVFARPVAWRVLDALIAATMVTLGVIMIGRR
ncbi:MAG TPA: LysE/ArgO family amino acid transporter [Actinocrinis sp.]|uniref:LysE/ArgO family amino acid transporter n=1 Tax=Actinocrinis sp. TaxID=1920516 RepID=UPI002DDD1B00|nr:LysE/ArgO family amino acid transporter [Actinocrinis sp.]HEV3172827.1 LysE/ArgO family amino acid transporter [Actinocrinis sp.]